MPWAAPRRQFAAEYLNDFWARYVTEEKSAYAAGLNQMQGPQYSRMTLGFPYQDRAQAEKLLARFLTHVSTAGGTLDMDLFEHVKKRRLDPFDRYESQNDDLTNLNYLSFMESAQATTFARERDQVASIQPFDLQDIFRRMLDAPLGVYTTGAADQHIGLEDMKRVFAPYRSDSPTAGQAIIPAAPDRPDMKSPAAKATGPDLS